MQRFQNLRFIRDNLPDSLRARLSKVFWTKGSETPSACSCLMELLGERGPRGWVGKDDWFNAVEMSLRSAGLDGVAPILAADVNRKFVNFLETEILGKGKAACYRMSKK